MKMNDDAIVELQRRVQRLADKHGASVYKLRDDRDVLVALLRGENDQAVEIITEYYAYCENHDDDHGDCDAMATA